MKKTKNFVRKSKLFTIRLDRGIVIGYNYLFINKSVFKSVSQSLVRVFPGTNVRSGLTGLSEMGLKLDFLN